MLSYPKKKKKKVHDVHMLNSGVSGVKVQKYLEKFQKENCIPTPRIFFLPTNISEGNFPILSESEKEKNGLPLSPEHF